MEKGIFISIISLAIGCFSCGQSIQNLQFPSVETGNFNSTPETVYVEVLCLIDNATYNLHGSDQALHNYILSFWKTVDKYFQLLSRPRVRITLSQILPPQGHYIPSLSEFNNNTHEILTAVGEFIYAEKNYLPHHDVAVLITPYELVTYKDNAVQHNVIGKTFRGTACHIDHKRKKVKSVAVVRDDGKLYKGVKKTISLIGQLLGARGEVLTDKTITSSDNDLNSPMKFNWLCSSRSIIRYFLNNENLNCLFNEPTTNINLEAHWLPGQEVSLAEQCKILTGNFGNCWGYKVSPCREMFCRDKYDQCTPKKWGPALEGSWCGNIDGVQHRCSYGRCEPFYPPRNETPIF